MKKIVARWKIPLSGLLIYIGAAYKRPRLGAQMRPSCITEKMMKTIRNAAEPSQTTNSDHFQPMSADGRQKITQPLAILAPRFRSRANLSCEVSPPESPNTLAKSHQTTQMSAYGRHQVSRVPPVAQPAPTRPPLGRSTRPELPVTSQIPVVRSAEVGS